MNAIALALRPASHRNILRWTLLLPVIAVAIGFRWVRARFSTPLTPAQLREAEKAKRRKILRELRGLEADDASPRKA